MIKCRRERDDDYIGPLRGWPKFFHRLFLLITFPLRKPLWTLLVLLVMFLAPTFRGIKPAEVHLWYWQQLKSSSDAISTTVADKAKTITDSLPMVAVPESENPPAKVVEVPVKKSSRTMFEQAKSAPVIVPEALQNVAPVVAKEPENAVLPAAVSQQTEPVKKKLPLKYLEKPQTVSGVATIISANELKIGSIAMFMHGVYADPKSANGAAAFEFLYSETLNKNVFCQIVAYTYQGVATALCSVDGINLNRELVKRGLSKNVALD